MNIDLWKKCVEFHGHECPGLAIGYRAAMAASEYFESIKVMMRISYALQKMTHVVLMPYNVY